VSICTRFSFTISKIHYRCIASQKRNAMHLQCDVERISRYSFYKYYLLFNFASSISYTIKCPSALGFGLPYPKSTTAVLLLKKEMRCISSVMLNAARYIHFINDFYYCSILPFRYINVSSFIQSFLTWKQFWIFNFASSISCTFYLSIRCLSIEHRT